jgi:hypothetical protein
MCKTEHLNPIEQRTISLPLVKANRPWRIVRKYKGNYVNDILYRAFIFKLRDAAIFFWRNETTPSSHQKNYHVTVQDSLLRKVFWSSGVSSPILHRFTIKSSRAHCPNYARAVVPEVVIG